MVKKGKDRAEKYAAKHDATVIMLRWKRTKDLSLERFRITATKQYLLDNLLSDLCIEYDLTYGQRGRLYDLLKEIFYQYPQLTELDLFYYMQEWLDKDLPIEIFDSIPSWVTQLNPMFEVCHFPIGYIQSRISIDPLPYDWMFPKEEDYSKETTETSEEEILKPADEQKETDLLETLVCAHNTCSVLIPLLPAPTIELTEYGINPLLNISLTYVQNPESYPQLDIEIETPNIYNFTPTINISVVKTP